MSKAELDIETDEKVEYALELIKTRNIFFYGPGGTGKTHTLKKLIKKLNEKYVVAVTASTGIAAININGKTLHSWGCIGIGDKHISYYKKFLDRDSYMETQVLIIDEISMIGKTVFELIDTLAKFVRGNKRPLGGLRVIVCGDFFQLQPVKDQWIFESEIWKQLDFKLISFEYPYRYSDVNYFNLLERCRRNQLTIRDIELLETRIQPFPETSVIPTKMYSTNLSTQSENMKMLNNLPGEKFTFSAEDSFKSKMKTRKTYENCKKNLDLLSPFTLELKIGAQVMITRNLDLDNGICNGTRGVVKEVDREHVIVQLVCGKEITIVKYDFKVETDEYVMIRNQIPLILAWALTIHKTQGLTVDCVVANLGSQIFSAGQSYVALSRVRSLDNLYLYDFDSNKIKCDEKVVEYDRIINPKTLYDLCCIFLSKK